MIIAGLVLALVAVAVVANPTLRTAAAELAVRAYEKIKGKSWTS